MSIKSDLQRLCAAYGPTGRENVIAKTITDMVREYADEISTDVMGNLIVLKKGVSGKKLMLAAHMDEIGLMVTHIDENGFLRIAPVGGISILGSRWRHVVFENGVRGVVASQTKDIKKAEDITMDKLFIDIGAGSRGQAQKLVSVGDVAKFTSEFAEMGGRLSSAAMDDRAGCVVLTELMKTVKSNPDDLYFVFTVQEEVGMRGAETSAFSISPDIGIALDVTPAGDTPESMPFTVDLGKGPAVKIKDRSLICSPSVVAMLESAAKEAGIEWQREVLTFGGTDAGMIQQTAGGVPSGVVSIPCRYTHSQTETVDIGDIEGAVRLLCALVQKGI